MTEKSNVGHIKEKKDLVLEKSVIISTTIDLQDYTESTPEYLDALNRIFTIDDGDGNEYTTHKAEYNLEFILDDLKDEHAYNIREDLRNELIYLVSILIEMFKNNEITEVTFK